MNIKVIAFYTNDFYKKQSERLVESLKRFEIPYELVRVNGPKTWNDAVCAKPAFIKTLLDTTQCDGVLYVDADAEFIQKPDLSIFKGVDFGAVWWKRSRNHADEVLTGTLYFRKNDVTRDFVADWIKATQKYRHTSTPEQHSIKELLDSEKWRFLMHEVVLGPEWAMIFDDMQEAFPNVTPIIKHWQASRTYRRIEAEEARQTEDGKNQG